MPEVTISGKVGKGHRAGRFAAFAPLLSRISPTTEPQPSFLVYPIPFGTRRLSLSVPWRHGLCNSLFHMPTDSKAKYTAKQKRQAEHIEESYEKRGASKKSAETRAWQTVNKQTGGGEKSGTGKRVPAKAKKASRKESGQRAAASRKVGSRKVQQTAPKKRASKSAK